jgi:hypothetical protein
MAWKAWLLRGRHASKHSPKTLAFLRPARHASELSPKSSWASHASAPRCMSLLAWVPRCLLRAVATKRDDKPQKLGSFHARRGARPSWALDSSVRRLHAVKPKFTSLACTRSRERWDELSDSGTGEGLRDKKTRALPPPPRTPPADTSAGLRHRCCCAASEPAKARHARASLAPFGAKCAVMGLAASRGSNPRAVPALLERHAHALQRFVGTEPVAVGDAFWCATPPSAAAWRVLRPARMPQHVASPAQGRVPVLPGRADAVEAGGRGAPLAPELRGTGCARCAARSKLHARAPRPR